MNVELDQVTKSYGRRVAVHPISLTLGDSVVGLLGPNGAGKTTLLRLVATSLTPTSGRVLISGMDTTDPVERVEARRRLGYVPQEVVFPRGMTAFGFVDYIAVLKEWTQTEERHREVRRVLAAVDLGDRAGMKIKALSGGQRRRLAIAQSLLGSPTVLILDEPTTGLDPEQRADLRATLSALGGTVLISTHQTEDVSALCDRVVVIDAGQVVFDGTVPQMLAHAAGAIHIGLEPAQGAIASWRTGNGAVRSVGGTPAAGSSTGEPTVEDAYLLLRHQRSETLS